MLLAQLIRAHRADRSSKPSRADQVGQQDRRKLNRLRHHGPHSKKTSEQESVKQFSGVRRVDPLGCCARSVRGPEAPDPGTAASGRASGRARTGLTLASDEELVMFVLAALRC